ncbi:phosphate starvation-inducible protein PsiF [Citrobacter freundii]|uniref:phosphate starvation-inducible protein PsiF n=1 Tax=Citrobacter freundii TaxID=546 RepID=UPI000764CC87|nr:phosphate starvation-inducible protein PsiF [Citrobacter freundii]EGT3577127.1 phosphate starvation-inducible protein PsiF [Citrobacter freundii]ELK7201157.1 phosphate starvation-inducible protein PsiF [Citrobacter freundii]EMA4454177.1 phosphate starvation-inducible protein PsiF [Citrobacter freundii]KWZ87873.1 PsiF repeat protein [Citrobacter freundii]MCO8023591.1 phosphate starvation-inducible protein PsiF [Citrobacter freundii]
MKITLLMTLLFGLIFLTTVGAAEKTLTPQQQRMTTCNQQATAQTLKGDARKTYMSDCLKNSKSGPEEKSLTPQQQKMSECNVKATEQSLKGDDRNKFMSACLKKSA